MKIPCLSVPLLALLSDLGAIMVVATSAHAGTVTVLSVKELVDCAAQSAQSVTMKPGVYLLIDHIPLAAIPERRQRKEWPLMVFSGSNNVFHLDGVTIEVDTALRKALRPPMHTSEFIVTGSSNVIRGLTITNIGEGVSPGGAALSITGGGNTIRDCTIYVRGSFPYGYGDLFGKGGPDIIGPLKKSGMHITGSGTRVVGCKLFMRSFGHGYFVQRDASDVSFEDCYVEGEMRPTDEMLAETNGPAFKVGFRTVARNRAGESHVTPGYMKSLSEDGFRTYGQHTNLSFRNCTAKNMRGGFELRTKTAVRLDNCAAIGCERGFWISSGATVSACQGDAQYGPLLFAEGDNASVVLTLLPAESTTTVHALAAIQGVGNRVTIQPSPQGERTRLVPILVGFGTPMMGEGMAPIPEKNVRNLMLRNETAMPIVIGGRASGGEIITRGPVQEDKGRDIVIKRLPESGR
jgi:hypothetical protein